jgi:hypothetical protein
MSWIMCVCSAFRITSWIRPFMTRASTGRVLQPNGRQPEVSRKSALQNGSRTTSPGQVDSRMARRESSAGNGAG